VIEMALFRRGMHFGSYGQVPVTLRSPSLLAKAVTTVDVLSRGRAILGIGAGRDAAEHQAYGFEFPGVAERMDRLGENLAICRALFTEERATVTGLHYRVAGAPNSPRPLAGGIPVLVGGGGERRTLDLAARYGDAFNVAGDPATVRRKFEVLEQHCRRVDPAEITRTAGGTPARPGGGWRPRRRAAGLRRPAADREAWSVARPGVP
jgi:alkanesulfonate monooxygenase SsuD/methylene tetrahydromethanopterin reductase-like flavin-dependent oxidoreductase (luciferase family)